MSSDNVLVRITGKSGATLDFITVETGNGDFLGCGFESRSFVLAMIARRARDKRGCPLEVAIGEGEYWEPEWLTANMSTYIVSYQKLAQDRRITTREQEAALRKKLARAKNESATLFALAPQATCRAVFTDPKWIEHVEVGDEFGTTSYDAVYDTP